MLAPFDGDIRDIAFVFAHTSRRPDGELHPYSVAAVRLSTHAQASHYTSHIHTSGNRARDYATSRIPQAELNAAPKRETVLEELNEFLSGCALALVFAPGGGIHDVSDLIPEIRVVDLGFVADFFTPWLHIASFKQLWEFATDEPRTKASFTALEGAETMLAFTRKLLGTTLSDTQFPAMRAVRYYLALSDTLFGACINHLQERFTDYFGGLLSPVASSNTGNWMQFLEVARAMPPQDDSPLPPIQPVPEEDIRELFDELAARRPGYRVREPQVEFAQCIAHSLNTASVAALEAGTGTGKTLGYLLPTMEFLSRNPSRRVAIATYTKSLQDQVYAREAAACAKLFGHYADVSVALVKGKSNYICAHKLDDVLTPDLTGTALLGWLYLAGICYRHREADCDDVSRTIRMYLDEDRALARLMNEVSAKSGCTSKHTTCPAQVVTAEASHAQLVITNHNKLSVMDHDGALSGLFTNCIIDEANHFENAVRTAFSAELSSAELFGYIAFVSRRCRGLLRKPGLSIRARDRASEIIDAGSDTLALMDSLRSRLLRMDPKSELGQVEIQREHEAFTGGEVINDIIALRKAVTHVSDAMALFNITEKTILPMGRNTRRRLRSVRLLLLACIQNLECIERDLSREEGSFASATLFPKNFILESGSVAVGGLVRRHILAPKDAVVFTSATMTFDKDFTPFNIAMGITEPLMLDDVEKPYLATILDPPFTPDYTLALPKDACDGGYRNKDDWRAATLKQIPALISKNKGRTLVLFASYEDLEWIRERLEASWDSEFPHLFQERGEPATALCDEFRAVEESVLFGVETFWHGVDFPGETLTQVIITRLPFPSISSPLQLARRRSMPDGAYWARCNYDTYIKFRQGIGRLVRREDDSGSVIVLDSRIAQKKFLHVKPLTALPPVITKSQPADRSKEAWTAREDLHLVRKLAEGTPLTKLATLHRRPAPQLAARVHLLDCSQTGIPAPWPDDVLHELRARHGAGEEIADIASAMRCNMPAARLRLFLCARKVSDDAGASTATSQNTHARTTTASENDDATH